MVEEIQQRFLQISPEGVSTLYDLGNSAVEVTLPLTGSFSVIIQISVSSGYSGNSLTRYRVSPCMLCQHLETLLNEANLASTALLSEAQMFSIAFPSLTRLGMITQQWIFDSLSSPLSHSVTLRKIRAAGCVLESMSAGDN